MICAWWLVHVFTQGSQGPKILFIIVIIPVLKALSFNCPQNHQAWKGPLEIIQSNLPLRQGHLAQITQELSP